MCERDTNMQIRLYFKRCLCACAMKPRKMMKNRSHFVWHVVTYQFCECRMPNDYVFCSTIYIYDTYNVYSVYTIHACYTFNRRINITF